MQYFNLEYNLIEQKNVIPYKIHLAFEHGDADVTTTETIKFKKEAEVVEFIKSFDEIYEKLNESCGELSKEVRYELETLKHSDILLLPDVYYTSGSNYAIPWIRSIEHADSTGNKFDVQIKRGTE